MLRARRVFVCEHLRTWRDMPFSSRHAGRAMQESFWIVQTSVDICRGGEHRGEERARN